MLLWFLLGLVLLVVGAELLVRGASRLAAGAGISPLVVGLTVVAFGTSAPELAVSVSSAWSGTPDMAVGNVVGSNIFNVLLILGLSALITPLTVADQLVRREVPLMILLSAGLLLVSLDGSIGHLEAGAFLLVLVLSTIWSIRAGRRSAPADSAIAESPSTRTARPATSIAIDVLLIVAGLTLLVLGARWLVESAVEFATSLGVSELVVSLTIVAAGTSLPEVATSLIAAVKGERDIAVGNVVGSNVFNILAVLGTSGVVAPDGLPVADALLSFDLPVMLAASIACLPIFATGHRIDRWEGGIFLAYYLAYTVYLVLKATGHDALAGYSWIMTAFVMPITALTLVVLVARSFARRRRLRAAADPPSR